jgi:hypothetical protein
MKTIDPFDDSQQRDRRHADADPWTSTSEFDQYRQGVELTQTKHYAQGMVKIHAGYNGQDGNHTIPQLAYGQSQNTMLDEVYHRDVIAMEPATYVSLGLSLTNVVIDKGVDLDVNVNVFDGVIEPFAIRDMIALRRDFKSVEHKVCAALGEGNVKDRDNTDMFVEIVRFDDLYVGHSAMNDNVNTTGGLVTVVESGSTSTRRASPFKENYPPKGLIMSTRMESDLVYALSRMGPATENSVPDNYVRLGLTGLGY